VQKKLNSLNRYRRKEMGWTVQNKGKVLDRHRRNEVSWACLEERRKI